jgi:hypothetical protein
MSYRYQVVSFYFRSRAHQPDHATVPRCNELGNWHGDRLGDTGLVGANAQNLVWGHFYDTR